MYIHKYTYICTYTHTHTHTYINHSNDMLDLTIISL